jgi:nucleolar protein 56
MLFIAFSPFGAFALKEKENYTYTIDDIEYYKIFNEEEIPKILYDLKRGNVQGIIENLKKEWNVDDEVDVEVFGKVNIAGEIVRNNLYELGKKFGVFKDYDDFINKMNFWALELTKLSMKSFSQQKDKLIIQTVEALDDLDKILNLLSERIREWYSLYFPEMDKIIKKHELYVNLITQFGDREKFTKSQLKKMLPSNVAKELANSAKSSMGGDISEEDLRVLRDMAEEIKRLYERRKELQDYLENLMEESAPNLTKIAGASLGARLISLAGGLEKLAKFPASTVQVLGAEKALFAHLREGAEPPKHGVIYQHPFIQSSPKYLRGKIARPLACKISIAARADVFGNYIGDTLLEQMEKKVEEIRKKYPKPPKKKKKEKPKPKGKKKEKKPKKEKPKKKKGKKKGKKGKAERKIIGKTKSRG